MTDFKIGDKVVCISVIGWAPAEFLLVKGKTYIVSGVNSLMEFKCQEWNKNIHLVIVDFKKSLTKEKKNY